MTTMTEELAAKLREPFQAEFVGKLPRITCKDCRDTPYTKCCGRHGKVRCETCGNFITNAHTHLDYVGHAETTDRLLQVDPAWTWEPVAFDENGLPRADSNGGLWIRLTVCGVTRLGYGAADGKRGSDAVKEAIGDAIRNASMRFGVALDLWGAKFKEKESDHSDEGADTHGEPVPPANEPRMLDSQRNQIFALFAELGRTNRDDQITYLSWIAGRDITDRKDVTVIEARKAIADLRRRSASQKQVNGAAQAVAAQD
jgi:hypothetical protein